MSRDFRPIDFKMWQDQYPMPSMYEGLIDANTGKHIYSQETIDYSHKFPMLSLCGPDVFCKLVEKHVMNEEIVQQIEDILNNRECDNKELVDVTMSWFKGELSPGYYMENNNAKFLEYIFKQIKQKEES